MRFFGARTVNGLSARNAAQRALASQVRGYPEFCVVSGSDRQKAGTPGETVIDMIEKGLIADHRPDRPRLRCAVGRCCESR
jgi:hypothetical protein